MIRTLSFLLLLLVVACSRDVPHARLAAGAEGTSYKSVGEGIGAVVNEDGRVELEVKTGPQYTGKHNVELLLRGDAEFAITENDARNGQTPEVKRQTSHMRSVLPLYPELLFIVYKDTLKPRDLGELLRGRRVCFGPYASATSRFARRLFLAFGIDTSEYTPVYTSYADRTLSDSVDICCALTGYSNPSIAEMLLRKNGRLWSLDSTALAGRGSAVDGFCLGYEGARPYILPKSSFGRFPENPVLMVAVDAMLVTRADVPDRVVRDVVASIIERRGELIDANPLLISITERFDPSTLSHPLHDGAKMYLERHEPSFIEKQADVIALFFSIAVTAAGALSAMVRWNNHRKKNRIDRFYRRVGEIEKHVDELESVEACRSAIDQIKAIRREAFDLLVVERLAADDSFRIFVTLTEDTIDEIKDRMEELAADRS